MYKLTDIYKQIKEEAQAAQVAQYIIYCDMDGVLCDFERRFEQFGGMSPNEYKTTKGIKKFWELIDGIGEQFWSEMPWMRDGKQLWAYISKYKPSLLSSPSYDSSSRYGKSLWAKENMPGTKLILAERKNKQNYSKKNRILIDDMPNTINEWNSRGGIGILHTSAENTINELKSLGL
jgi:hypothetical protein